MHPLSRTLIAAALLAAGTTAHAAAGTTPSAEQIVARYVAARGGLEGWHKVHSMAWNGHVESADPMAPQMPFMMLFRRPNATRFELIVNGRQSVRVFDGTKGWKARTANGGQFNV